VKYTRDYDVRDFGAVGDSITMNTSAIQKAIDQCSRTGGTVIIANGCYLTGTLFLRDNTHLKVEAGAVLKGSSCISDYSTDTFRHMYKDEESLNRCLLFASDAQNIEISGMGCIDGNGGLFPDTSDPQHNRPMTLRFLNCSHISFHSLTIKNTPSWAAVWLYCSDIIVDGVTVDSSVHGTSDCLDFDGCENVRVSNCSLKANDDCLCLQSSRADRPCRNVTVTNCSFTSNWDALRIGLLSRGNIDNVTVSNCVFHEIGHVGLLLELCEGGDMGNMVFTGLSMKNTRMPIFLVSYQQRACVDAPAEVEPMGRMRGFLFSSISCVFEKVPVKCSRFVEGVSEKNSLIFISGLPGHDIEDIRFQNIFLETNGGDTGTEAAGERVPEFDLEYLKGWWAGIYRFDEDRIVLPTHGVYARHVQGLKLSDMTIRTRHPDDRASVYVEDGKNVDCTGLDIVNDITGVD